MFKLYPHKPPLLPLKNLALIFLLPFGRTSLLIGTEKYSVGARDTQIRQIMTAPHTRCIIFYICVLAPHTPPL